MELAVPYKLFYRRQLYTGKQLLSARTSKPVAIAIQLLALNKVSHACSQLDGLLLPSTGLCKSAKYARQQVGVLYQKFYPSPNISSLLQLYLAYIRSHMRPPPTGTYQLRECRSLDLLRCALKTGVLDMSLCFSDATFLPLAAEETYSYTLPEIASSS